MDRILKDIVAADKEARKRVQKKKTECLNIQHLVEAKKAEILAPKKRKPRKTKKQKLEAILKQAQKAGLKPEEIAERLGVTLEND